MRLLRLSGHFGRLDGEVLEFQNGLNLIELPNESGKSTWCALLCAMLYGIDSRERDKDGQLAAKNRYQPWNGKPMDGLLECEHEGRRLRLRRGADRGRPFPLLSVEDMDTGLAAAEWLDEQIGVRLIGVSEAVFVRTVFFAQGSSAVTPHAELERRITALVTAGEEESSYVEAARRLNDWHNRRAQKRGGKGAITNLTEQRESLRTRLRQQQALVQDIKSCQMEQARCEQELAELREAQREQNQKTAQEANETLKRSRERWLLAEERCLRLEQTSLVPPPDVQPFSGMTAAEAQEQAEQDVQLLRQLEQEQQEREKTAQTYFKRIIYDVALLAVGIALAFFFLPALLLSLIGGADAIRRVLRNRQQESNQAEQDELLAQYGVRSAKEILANAQKYASACTHYAQQLQTLAVQRQDALALAQRLRGSYEQQSATLTQQRQGSESEEIRAVQVRCSALKSAADTARGRLQALGNPEELLAEEKQLTAEITRMEQELAAIILAEEQLSLANEQLRRRFSPAVNRRAGEIFSAVTGGAYESLRIDERFRAELYVRGGMLPRSQSYLSTGTLEQLYLAVRLAICELTYAEREPVPLVLDDAFTSYDDERLAQALAYLQTLETQIILFSCQSRERELLAIEAIFPQREQVTQAQI